jgi:hypothetical protein
MTKEQYDALMRYKNRFNFFIHSLEYMEVADEFLPKDRKDYWNIYSAAGKVEYGQCYYRVWGGGSKSENMTIDEMIRYLELEAFH